MVLVFVILVLVERMRAFLSEQVFYDLISAKVDKTTYIENPHKWTFIQAEVEQKYSFKMFLIDR